MTWIEELQQFSSNGGLYHKGVSPQWGEPYYEIVNQKMLKRKFKLGDRVRITVKRSDTDDPVVVDDAIILCFGEKMLECLTEGEKEHRNRENLDHFFYFEIKDISLKQEAQSGFNLKKMLLPDRCFQEPDFVNGFDTVRNRDKPDMKKETQYRDIFEKFHMGKSFDNDFALKITPKLYCPYALVSSDAEVYVDIPDLKDVIHVERCKTGTPWSNKNLLCAYNFDEYNKAGILITVPKGEYHNVNIVCVWKIILPGKNGRNIEKEIISMVRIGELLQGKEKGNFFEINLMHPTMGVLKGSLHKYGKTIFLENFMEAEAVLIGRFSDGSHVSLRDTSNSVLNSVLFAASMAHYGYDIKRMAAAMACDQEYEGIVDVWSFRYDKVQAGDGFYSEGENGFPFLI